MCVRVCKLMIAARVKGLMEGSVEENRKGKAGGTSTIHKGDLSLSEWILALTLPSIPLASSTFI